MHRSFAIANRTTRRTRLGVIGLLTTALVGGVAPWGSTGGTTPASAATSRPADTAGSAPIGSARYAVPSGAVYASPGGNDSWSGRAGAPVRTITRALQLVPAGGTVVLRTGLFHETVTVTKSGVTIQNYPGESVWLDGSVPVAGWTSYGSIWKRTGWTARFDSSPTFTKGAPDGTTAGWQFVNASYPMASHPDMVFRDGAPMRQVRYRSQVRSGTNTFFLDTATSTVYVGLRPTSGMRGATIAKAISVRAPGVTLRGFGVRRFGNSVWHIGAITLEGTSDRMANMWVEQNASSGVAVVQTDASLDRVTIRRNGLMGVHADKADRLRITGSALTGNNTEHFNIAPATGGIKVTKTRTITITGSNLSGNRAPGFWADQSVYDMRLASNNIVGNTGAGIFLEISALAVVADNLITHNGGNGVKVNNTSNVRIWNNTIIDNSRQLNIVQDARLASNTSWGHDPRRPNPDPTMTWVLGPVEVRNNVLGLPGSGNCILCVEDYTHQRSAAQIGVTSASNIYNRTSSRSPQWTHVWSSGSTNPYVFTGLADFQRSTGQDRASVAYETSTAVTSAGSLTSAAALKGTTIATALPSDLATLTAHPAGSRQVGVWGR